MNQFLLPVTTSVLFALAGFAAESDSLESGFYHPPDSARPRTYWHWMNGNITREGITADLEAMKQVGIGGAIIVNVDCDNPRGPVAFMSPEWQADFKFAVQEANRLGLKLCVENCAGWSSSGGPWITPEYAMQHVVTSELQAVGPEHFKALLPQPPSTLDFYRDIAVLAFPTPADGPEEIPDIEAKDGDNGTFVLAFPASTNASPGSVIPGDAIVNLTGRLHSGGRLDWDVPKGRWTILRVGYTPTGVKNHPAPAEGTGLECDKLSKSALDTHWNGFMQKIVDDVGPLAGKTLDCSLIDSYEVGGQNWTKDFREEFEKRRGYDPLKFLPTFTGRVVDNPEVSERFLWDVRRTIADLFAEDYYGQFAELCRAHGLMSTVEPYDGPVESLQSGAPVDLVMGEFWTGSQDNPSVKLAASVAHIYGKTIVGAESFTTMLAHWQEYPYSLKELGDRMFCEGVNRYTFHQYAMQPWTNRWPGMTMGQFGLDLGRTETWWKQSRPWIEYITRSEFLLQQGRSVEDVAYFDGQSAPAEMRAGNPSLPAGYDYDGVDADVLMHGAEVKDGRITLNSGANYAVLVLPPEDSDMTPAMLRSITELVRAGATVIGPRPQHSPSLEDYPECDLQVERMADGLWGKCDGKTVLENSDGKGRIIWGKSLADVFAEKNLKPDFEYHGASRRTVLAYTHRIAGNTDIYFISNQRQQFDSAECTFRVKGEIPELWHPDTGVIETAPIWSEHDGRTSVALNFDPVGSVFVIFRHQIEGRDHLIAVEGNGPEVAAAVPRKLQILKAVYAAVPGFKNRKFDVTARVKGIVRSGTRRIAANDEIAGQDPAPGIVKQLRVEFLLNDEWRTNQVKEGETLVLPVGAEVVHAVYGQLQPATVTDDSSVDLTQKIREMAKGGQVDMKVSDEFAGRDPAPGMRKELRVDFTADGNPSHLIAHEGNTLILPPTPVIGLAPQWQTSVAADGSLLVSAWSNGRVELRTARGKMIHLNATNVLAPEKITGAWQLSFPGQWGAPPSMTLDRLISWPDCTNIGVCYFSGTATYEKDVKISADRLGAGRELWLDLGVVKDFAEVSLNGHDFGDLWKPPFRVNITDVAKAGANHLVIKVTNLWPNRVIGDEHLPPDSDWNGPRLKSWPQWLLDGAPSPTGRFTFTTWRRWTRDSPLLESGLLGPVALRTAEVIPVP